MNPRICPFSGFPLNAPFMGEMGGVCQVGLPVVFTGTPHALFGNGVIAISVPRPQMAQYRLGGELCSCMAHVGRNRAERRRRKEGKRKRRKEEKKERKAHTWAIPTLVPSIFSSNPSRLV
jgi:hypothetical protein